MERNTVPNNLPFSPYQIGKDYKEDNMHCWERNEESFSFRYTVGGSVNEEKISGWQFGNMNQTFSKTACL